MIALPAPPQGRVRGGREAKGTDGRWWEETAVTFNSESAGAAAGCDVAAA